MKYFLFIGWFIILSLELNAQDPNYVFQHINSKDGLASNQAKGIFQDSKGYYWIATDSGLQRFDGKYFSGVSTGNNNKKVYAPRGATEGPILEDKEGNIWGRCEGSISIFHPLTGQLESIEINDDNLTSNKSDIGSFCKDKSGDIWIVTKYNLYKYDYSNHKAIKWLAILTEIDNTVPNKILYDNVNNVLWVAGGPDIISVDIKTKLISSPFRSSSPSFFSKFAEYPLAFNLDHNGNLWFSDWVGRMYKFNTFNFKKNVYTAYDTKYISNASDHPNATSFGEDAMHKVWIGTDQGMFYYDEIKDSVVIINELNRNSLISIQSDIHDFCLDNEGNMLACTNDGIIILTQAFNRFTTIYEKSIVRSFPKISVHNILETTSGDILVSTWGKGWFLFNKHFILKKHFYNAHPPLEWSEYKKNNVWCFAEDLNGKLWIGYQNGLIGLYDTLSNNIVYKEVHEFDNATIRIMKCDSKGNIWFGLSSGFLGKWDAIKNSFYVYKNFSHLSNRNPSFITDIIINNKEEIWVATYRNGFFKFDPLQEIIVENHNIYKSDSTHALIISFTQLNDSIIGLSTYPNGVVLFNINNKSFSLKTVEGGLALNAIVGLANDHHNNLWIATSDGLFRMNYNNNKLVAYNEEDGIYVREFDFNIVTLRDGRMVVPAATGFIYFSPETITSLSEPPPVIITDFKIFSTTLLIDSALSLKCIELKHSQNFITINYASLSFAGRSNTQYSYQLDNVNKDWVSAGTERFASYTDLSPGLYTFRVKCENRDGIPSNKVTELYLYIHPPWWFSWWAYCLYGFLAISIIYSLYKNRIHQLEKKQATRIKTILLTQAEERKRIAIDLHDTIGSTLSSISIYSSAVEQMKVNQFPEVQSTVSLIGQSARIVMQNMSDIIWAINPANDTFQNMIERLQIFSTQLLEAKDIQLQFDIPEALQSIKLTLPQRKNIYLILREAIHNVAKYSKASHCLVSAKLENKIIDLVVKDNGSGFSQIIPGLGGNGMINMQARADELKAQFHIHSEMEIGTRVSLQIAYA